MRATRAPAGAWMHNPNISFSESDSPASSKSAGVAEPQPRPSGGRAPPRPSENIMNTTKSRLASVLLGLLAAYSLAPAEVWIDPEEDPAAYCRTETLNCNGDTIREAWGCSTIRVRQRGYTSCCTYETWRCAGSSTSATVRSLQFGGACSNGYCTE